MITLFVIGILVLVWRLIGFALKMAWGLAKGVLFVCCLPLLVVVLLFAGLTSLALPILVIALVAALLLPVCRRI